MRASVGVAIAYDAFRVVVVRGGKVVWVRETEREPGDPNAESLAEALREAPLERWHRPLITAVVGPHASQVKALSGLPPVEDATLLSAMVRENVGTFFVGRTADLRTTAVRPVEPGLAWCCAIGATHIECLRTACRSLRFKLVSIAPSAVVLPYAVRTKHFLHADGPVTLDLETAEGDLVSVRRVPTSQCDRSEAVELVDELSPLGERAEQFADAYGAAVAPIGHPLTLGPSGDSPWERRRHLRATLPPAIALTAAAVALLLSPMIPAHAARTAESRLNAIYASEEWRLTTDVSLQLRRATTVLTELDSFARSRPQRAALLADLAAALPDGAAVEHIDLAASRVRIIAVAPEASSAIAAMREVPGLTSLRVVGDIVPAVVGANEVERFTLALEAPDSTTERSR